MSYNPFIRGAYPVGVRTVTAVDQSRGGRELAIEIWYPATGRYRGQDVDDTTCDRFVSAPGLPEGLQHAVRDAQPSPGRYPLILNSHAAASHRRDAALLGPHLASHGYVVAAPDHPGDTIADIVTSHRASDEETVANRPPDAIFAIDYVLGSAEPAIAAIIDATRLGMCGVSLGGWTTLRVNSLDRRIRAAFVAAPSWGLSGPFPQTKMQTAQIRLDDWARPVPTFVVAGGRDMLVIVSDLRELYAKLSRPKRFAVLRGASHFHWGEGAEQLYQSCLAMWESGAISVPGADVIGLAKATPAFSELCPNWHATETLQSLCLAQMDAELKGNAEARAFLDLDLARVFSARGIALDEVTASAIAVSL